MAPNPREGVHFITKPYDKSCPSCRRRFSHPASMQVHKPCLPKRLIHLDHEYDRYECFECGKRFREMGNLRQHVTFHLEKMYHCMICGMDHYTKQQVERHIQCEHHRMKPFRCPHSGCGKRYTEKRQLTRHCEAKHMSGTAVTESVSCISEQDDDSDREPEVNSDTMQSDSDRWSLPPVSSSSLQQDQSLGLDDDLVIVPIGPLALEAGPSDASAVTVAPGAETLDEFLRFQRFLKMMQHCDLCDGYFLSDDLLKAHCAVHSASNAFCEPPVSESCADAEEKPAVTSALLISFSDID